MPPKDDFSRGGPFCQGVAVNPVEHFCGYPVRIRRFNYLGRELELLGPGNFEGLVDDPRVVTRFTQDEYMPYWAEFWPASLLLADEVAAWPAVGGPQAPRVLELGCGLGLVALIASSLGYRVIASDYDEDALAFVRESARRNQIMPPETRFVDWREDYPDLSLDFIVAAEVLYERRNIEPIAQFIAQRLAPGGKALLIDGDRQVADAFREAVPRAGLRLTETARRRAALTPSDKPIVGRLFEVERP